MSKTIELQIEKSRVLIEGLNSNIAELRSKGINDECDALREKLSGKVKEMNEVLKRVKDSFADHKRIVKSNYPQERWINYGVQDKR